MGKELAPFFWRHGFQFFKKVTASLAFPFCLVRLSVFPVAMAGLVAVRTFTTAMIPPKMFTLLVIAFLEFTLSELRMVGAFVLMIFLCKRARGEGHEKQPHADS